MRVERRRKKVAYAFLTFSFHFGAAATDRDIWSRRGRREVETRTTGKVEALASQSTAKDGCLIEKRSGNRQDCVAII